MDYSTLQQFYIPEEQSIYLLSHQDAQKLKDWVALCIQQLEQLGYRDIELIGKGAFGFVFAGLGEPDQALVFKFSRINLAQHVQDRLQEEAYMLGQVRHDLVPKLVEFQRVGRQAIMVMERAKGLDLEQLSLQRGRLSPRLVVKISAQLVAILKNLRAQPEPLLRGGDLSEQRLLVHGDIKPSNLVFDPDAERVSLIDWGSSVFAQLDHQRQWLSASVMETMSADLQHSNARLGDVYFIGDEQLNGGLSSPRFDEQGLAGALYALASGQSCRFGHLAIPPTSLGLPVEFARVLEAMLSDDAAIREKAGDYLLRNMSTMSNNLMVDLIEQPEEHLIPVWVHPVTEDIETVSYSSRKAFLQSRIGLTEVQQTALTNSSTGHLPAGPASAEHDQPEEGPELSIHDGFVDEIAALNDVQFDRYYKNFMQGMGDTEKAFLASIGRLAKYPAVGGLVVRWESDGVYIDSSLNLYDQSYRTSFITAVNNMVTLARSIYRQGVFKSCLFNAKTTLHIDRDEASEPFSLTPDMAIPYELSEVPGLEDQSRIHSYFEDGRDPEELLELPKKIIHSLEQLNDIHHTGLIIFEALPNHLKIHNFYRLLDPSKEAIFRSCLDNILNSIPELDGLGVAGFMKLPYKDTRFFTHIDRMPEKYYPKNPRLESNRS